MRLRTSTNIEVYVQHVEKRVIGLKNPSVEIPNEDPDNVGVHQPSHASPEQGGCVHLFVLFCGSRRLRSDGVRLRDQAPRRKLQRWLKSHRGGKNRLPVHIRGSGLQRFAQHDSHGSGNANTAV